MTRRHLSRLAAAVLTTAAAGLTVLATPAPAAAATCSTASGVSVVVDFKGLGGRGVEATCVPGGGGKRVADLWPQGTFPWVLVQGEPFVCRISGLPTQNDEPCNDTPPADAYWGLWWSDGKTGTWSYSSYGVSTLKVPDGGYVAFAWKQGAAPASAPGVAPAPHPSATPTPTPSSSPSPTRSPSPSPTRSPTSDPTKSPAAATQTPSASEPASVDGATVTESASASESASPTTSATTSASPSATATSSAADRSSPPDVQEPQPPVDTEAAESDDGGVPIALGLVLVIALFAASAGAVVLRRRQAP
jgi:hypothetical protein